MIWSSRFLTVSRGVADVIFARTDNFRDLHIPLQSGSDEVLKLMRRRYDTALFASKVKKIKEVMPDAFIGVDVIVGTRGETEEYFEQAYRFIQSKSAVC